MCHLWRHHLAPGKPGSRTPCAAPSGLLEPARAQPWTASHRFSTGDKQPRLGGRRCSQSGWRWPALSAPPPAPQNHKAGPPLTTDGKAGRGHHHKPQSGACPVTTGTTPRHPPTRGRPPQLPNPPLAGLLGAQVCLRSWAAAVVSMPRCHGAGLAAPRPLSCPLLAAGTPGTHGPWTPGSRLSPSPPASPSRVLGLSQGCAHTSRSPGSRLPDDSRGAGGQERGAACPLQWEHHCPVCQPLSSPGLGRPRAGVGRWGCAPSVLGDAPCPGGPDPAGSAVLNPASWLGGWTPGHCSPFPAASCSPAHPSAHFQMAPGLVAGPRPEHPSAQTQSLGGHVGRSLQEPGRFMNPVLCLPATQTPGVKGPPEKWR